MQGHGNLRGAIMTRLQTGTLVQCTPYATLHGGLSKGPANLNTAAVWTHHGCRATQVERGWPGSVAAVPAGEAAVGGEGAGTCSLRTPAQPQIKSCAAQLSPGRPQTRLRSAGGPCRGWGSGTQGHGQQGPRGWSR